MKKHVLLAVACLATMTTGAQNIAVVNSNNKTTVYQMLDSALVHAEDGDVIYLPGGGFKVNDSTKIAKKVTIMGVSHRGDVDNVDGATLIAGNLQFQDGSSGSSIIGVYVNGTITIGTETDPINNFTIKYCNLNSIKVVNSLSSGLVINQCYIRGDSHFGNTNAKITNCITACLYDVNGGTIMHNIVLGNMAYYNGTHFSMWNIVSSTITGNIFVYAHLIDSYRSSVYYGVTNCVGSQNYNANWGDDPVTFDGRIQDVFVKWNNGAISPSSNFHFIEDYKEYEKIIGIYAGSSFNDDKALAPIPRIVSKKVDEQTSADGTLTVTVTIKAQ